MLYDIPRSFIHDRNYCRDDDYLGDKWFPAACNASDQQEFEDTVRVNGKEYRVEQLLFGSIKSKSSSSRNTRLFSVTRKRGGEAHLILKEFYREFEEINDEPTNVCLAVASNDLDAGKTSAQHDLLSYEKG